MSGAGRELIPGLFASQAARTPGAVAVVDRGREVDYAALDRRSDRVAGLLRAAGTAPGDLVGVCLPRGVDMVAALLGVWKAGAAYVPLDPAHPADRLRRIAEDTGTRLVITDGASCERLPDGPSPLLTDSFDDASDTVPPAVTDPDLFAYAIHTSGSTGRPKGVLIGHGAIANRVRWTVRRHGLGPADRVLQKTTLGFDAAAWEIFAPLVSGGTVVLAPPEAVYEPAALLRAVAEHEVTVLQVVPSQLRLLVDEPGLSGCRSLRLLFSAGEPLDASLCARVRERLPVRIWNTYGPTECAIDVTAHLVGSEADSGRVPIGRPIDGVSVRVLDPEGALVPIGVTGELYAGGAGLAHGYLGRPALTAERFLPDPYGPPGSRMYRTGDRARWSPDGTLRYEGRTDDQVKVNGVRVEPGEVEAALAGHPGLRGAAVTSAPGPDGAPRLVAYVVSRNGAIPPERLRGFLRDTLPEPLIPSVFVHVRDFPLTASGKVDRAALPAPEFGGAAGVSGPDTAKATPAEAVVASIWEDLLGVRGVRPDDDFFQRGGSSLLLARLAARLSIAGDREISLHELFAVATVTGQARLLETAAEPVATVHPVPREGPLPLSVEQHQLWFLDRMDPGNPEWVTPLLISLPGGLDEGAVGRALAKLAARHEILRTRYLTVDGEPRQVIDEEVLPPLRTAELEGDGQALGELVAAEFARGFDLVRGPVWRALLVRRPGRDHVLALAVHHIASDGRSSVLLGDELRTLCAALADGEPDLPAPPVQYADYAVWQRHRMTDEVLEPHVRFWREELADLQALELPTDRPRPAVRDPRGATVAFPVAEQRPVGVAALAAQRGTTPFAVYLTAFVALLARWSGQWDVPVGVPVAGRTRPELAGVAGPFHNTLVLRCDLDPGMSFEEALDRVWDRDRRALAHRDLPFERVVAELGPARDLSRTPLYQVMFNFMDEGVTVGGELDLLKGVWRVAKTDLTLFLQTGQDGSVDGLLEYAASLFDATTAARMADHFLTLLDAALAAPSVSLQELGALADAPRDPVERLLARRWSELLGREVGVVQNFFHVGGTSRLALTLMARLQEDFDLDLPVRSIFERPTVARLAEAIRELAGAAPEHSSTSVKEQPA